MDEVNVLLKEWNILVYERPKYFSRIFFAILFLLILININLGIDYTGTDFNDVFWLLFGLMLVITALIVWISVFVVSLFVTFLVKAISKKNVVNFRHFFCLISLASIFLTIGDICVVLLIGDINYPYIFRIFNPFFFLSYLVIYQFFIKAYKLVQKQALLIISILVLFHVTIIILGG